MGFISYIERVVSFRMMDELEVHDWRSSLAMTLVYVTVFFYFTVKVIYMDKMYLHFEQPTGADNIPIFNNF